MLRGVIMGGSPSTGSSLLVNILDRHSRISAGPETYLFIHPRLYYDWNRYRKYLIRTSKWGGLKSQSWFRMNGASLLQSDYGWTAPELKRLVGESRDLSTFAQHFMSRRMQKSRASIWLEKSPANAVSFPLFLSAFGRSSVIHTVRDPYDAVASLVARGHSPYYAAGAYIIHTAMGLRVMNHPRATMVRYEDLVLQSRDTVGGLLQFLGLKWEDGILEPREKEKRAVVKMEGWLHNEKGEIGGRSIGRFDQLPASEKKRIIDALARFRINPDYAGGFGIEHTDLRSVAETLQYRFLKADSPDLDSLERQKRRDQISRALRLYPAFGKNYPGELRR